MSEVRRVTAQIRPPKGDDPGQVCVGYYTVKDGLLTMTGADGVKMLREDGTPYEHKLAEADNPAAIAQLLTKEIRRYLRGETKSQQSFGKPLNYPKTGWM
jgi:hypothetical protein